MQEQNTHLQSEPQKFENSSTVQSLKSLQHCLNEIITDSIIKTVQQRTGLDGIKEQICQEISNQMRIFLGDQWSSFMKEQYISAQAAQICEETKTEQFDPTQPIEDSKQFQEAKLKDSTNKQQITVSSPVLGNINKRRIKEKENNQHAINRTIPNHNQNQQNLEENKRPLQGFSDVIIKQNNKALPLSADYQSSNLNLSLLDVQESQDFKGSEQQFKEILNSNQSKSIQSKEPFNSSQNSDQIQLNSTGQFGSSQGAQKESLVQTSDSKI
ncbi:UNKNOWN [Stylonychia lemnae]|uniref:Uncharacterized protein n=1 Tax=Stylonychia lemnae TaxID=5949 RepID=A0A077ZTS0_STYLE|nr:UNKNOWN [Stylonychia lemnae]|eukprot:CDW71831.1 UNKNOWN [Stylonychia lemnae]